MLGKLNCYTFAFCFGLASLAHGGGINQINIEFVDVGDPGNLASPNQKYDGQGGGYGAVENEFRIGKYEVTNDQYVGFLNSVAASDPYGLFKSNMTALASGGILRSGSDGSYTYSAKTNFGNKPVNLVSAYDGMRLANWLHNGQQNDPGTTEFGAYNFTGIDTAGMRTAGAKFFLPNEHEWQKAAYYEAGADTHLGGGWWQRFGGQDFAEPIPAIANSVGDVINPGPLVANYKQGAQWNDSNPDYGNVVTVGSAGNVSPYGAYDMIGNVFEWVENDPTKPDPEGVGPYAVMGGSFRNDGHYVIYERNLVHHSDHNRPTRFVGLRLAAAAITTVPEPSGLVFTLAAACCSVASRRRRGRRA